MDEIPVMRYPNDGESDKHTFDPPTPSFTCARFWEQVGGEYSVNSCNGIK